MERPDILDAQPELFGTIDGTKSYMYEELWKLCAGPLCNLPKLGEKVYYFPQGHIELVEASTREELDHTRPLFNLPSKIRCRVFAIQLKAEKNTDEVYAEITLMPDETQVIVPTSNENHQQRATVKSFTKVLSPSDTSPRDGLLILKKHATECLPPLNMSPLIPSQVLIAKDIHDNTWKFKHSFRGKPERHILTTGWSAFAKAKKLVAGDGFILIRGETGELRVGIRRARYQQNNIPSSLIPTQSINHEVIDPSHIFDNQCMFSVVYKPRSSQFVVSYEKFVNAMNNEFNVGSRFVMHFEDEDFSDKKYSGTVIGMNDISPHWKKSEWRSLQVQWDEFASFLRPDKVSPWEIEQIGQPNMSSSINVPKLSYCDAIEDSRTSSDWLMSYQGPTISKPNNDQMIPPRKDATTSFRLFGFDLSIPSETKCLNGPIDSYQNLGSSREFQSNYIRSCIKVQMQGEAIGRAVDLTTFDGYNHLIHELDKKFDLKGELQTRNQWELVFIDNEGDMMLVGDDPWREFSNIVKKILISSKEEVKKMKSENKSSQPESTILTSSNVSP